MVWVVSDVYMAYCLMVDKLWIYIFDISHCAEVSTPKTKSYELSWSDEFIENKGVFMGLRLCQKSVGGWGLPSKHLSPSGIVLCSRILKTLPLAISGVMDHVFSPCWSRDNSRNGISCSRGYRLMNIHSSRQTFRSCFSPVFQKLKRFHCFYIFSCIFQK